MSVIKWTAKGVRLSGPVMTREDMDAWLRSRGHKAFQNTVDRFPASWFLGEYRARQKIFLSLSTSVNDSHPLRERLQAGLAKLPALIGAASARIERVGPRTLGASNNAGWLVVVPRALVRKVYRRALVKGMSHSSDLAELPGVLSLLLARKTLESERLFFEMVKKQGHYVNSTTGMIFGVDANFDWQWGGVAGHYYYGECTRLDKLLTKRKDRVRFQANMKRGLEQMKVEIGVLNQQKIHQIVKSLRV